MAHTWGNKLFGPPDEDEIRQAEDEKRRLSEFLAEFPIQPLYTQQGDGGGLWCFWTQTETSRTNSSVDKPDTPDSWMIHEKMKSTFTRLKCNNLGLVQFWVPVTKGGRRLLTTFDQPIAVGHLNRDVAKYRMQCEKYLYEVEPNAQIIHGPPATAFLHRLPRFIHDLRCHSAKIHSNPLLASALALGLCGYIALPIFDPSSTCCVGVLEYFKSKFGIFSFPEELFQAIRKEDLIIFDVRECWPYHRISGLHRAMLEIQVGMEAVCNSFHLPLSQAWIRYEQKNYASFIERKGKASYFDFLQSKQGIALKLLHYRNYEVDSRINWFPVIIESGVVPLRMGEGLVGKALENHESYLCRDISVLDDNETWLSHTSSIKGGCFAVCLRSTYTQHLDYVLEFFWTDCQDVTMLLESLPLTLNKKLPSFEFVDMGKKLCVKEMKHSGEARDGILEMSQKANKKHKTSPISLQREVIEQQFGRTMTEAAKNLNVSLSTLKRKCKDVGINEWQGKRNGTGLCGNHKGKSRHNISPIRDPFVSENTVTVKARYGDDLIKFSLPMSSATLVAVKDEIGKQLGLNSEAYKLKYYDKDNDLISIVTQDGMTDCITSLNSTTIRLHVVANI